MVFFYIHQHLAGGTLYMHIYHLISFLIGLSLHQGLFAMKLRLHYHLRYYPGG